MSYGLLWLYDPIYLCPEGAKNVQYISLKIFTHLHSYFVIALLIKVLLVARLWTFSQISRRTFFGHRQEALSLISKHPLWSGGFKHYYYVSVSHHPPFLKKTNNKTGKQFYITLIVKTQCCKRAGYH